MSDGVEDLRRIFADPASADLYHGMGSLWMRPVDEPSAFEDRGQDQNLRAQLELLIRIVEPEAREPADISALDQYLNQRVEFPDPFQGEGGYRTTRGIAGYHALQAIYQTWRLLSCLNGQPDRSVVEIGPGMGRTVYYAYRAGLTDYTTIDLPLGIVAQACFLGAVLGPEKLFLPGDDPAQASGRIKLLSAGSLPTAKFALALNADSLTEMPWHAALGYLEWINCNLGAFLSVNHKWNYFTVAEVASVAFPAAPVTAREYPMRDGYVEELFLLRQQSASRRTAPINRFFLQAKVASRRAASFTRHPRIPFALRDATARLLLRSRSSSQGFR